MQAGRSQVEEKPELLFTFCKVPACMPVSGVALLTVLLVSGSIFNSQS